MNFRLLLDHAQRTKDAELLKLVKLTLDKMIMGGIYDQVGGGFHRYSTERSWTVPHFEKMLYDNAQLVELYAEAYQVERDADYARVIRETLAFIQREMTSPEGAFYSALDADSNGNEGEFYVWTAAEIDKALPDKADAVLLKTVYSVSGTPNFEEKYFILRLNKKLDALAAEQKLSPAELNKKLSQLKQTMLAYRSKRVRPFLDTKILTAWNGQMIAAYAKAGQVLKEPEFVKAAARAADFLLQQLRTKDGRLLRTYGTTADGKGQAKLNGYLDDYAFFIHGLLNLYEADKQQRWLDEAKSLSDLMVKWYGDGENGGYFFTSSDHEKFFARPKDYFDNAQPSANGVALDNFVRLWRITHEENYRKLAEKSFRQFASVMKAAPNGVPGMCLALHSYLDALPAVKTDAQPPVKVAVVTGREKTEDVVKLSAKLGETINGKTTLVVNIMIASPWHIYANPSGGESTPTSITVRANGKIIAAEVDYPKGIEVEDKMLGNYHVYEKEVIIKATLSEKPEGELEIAAKLQACSSGENSRCLLPTTLKTKLK